jgi:hypothetical protein
MSATSPGTGHDVRRALQPWRAGAPTFDQLSSALLVDGRERKLPMKMDDQHRPPGRGKNRVSAGELRRLLGVSEAGAGPPCPAPVLGVLRPRPARPPPRSAGLARRGAAHAVLTDMARSRRSLSAWETGRIPIVSDGRAQNTESPVPKQPRRAWPRARHCRRDCGREGDHFESRSADR